MLQPARLPAAARSPQPAGPSRRAPAHPRCLSAAAADALDAAAEAKDKAEAEADAAEAKADADAQAARKKATPSLVLLGVTGVVAASGAFLWYATLSAHRAGDVFIAVVGTLLADAVVWAGNRAVLAAAGAVRRPRARWTKSARLTPVPPQPPQRAQEARVAEAWRELIRRDCETRRLAAADARKTRRNTASSADVRALANGVASVGVSVLTVGTAAQAPNPRAALAAARLPPHLLPAPAACAALSARSPAVARYAAPGGPLAVNGVVLEMLLAPGALQRSGVAPEHVDDARRAIHEVLALHTVGVDGKAHLERPP